MALSVALLLWAEACASLSSPRVMWLSRDEPGRDS